MIRLLSSRPAWAILGVVAIVLLVFGSIQPGSGSPAWRVARLDSIIKCPSCEDLSIAQSDAASAITLRTEVASWVHEGWSDQRIESEVVARYGQSGLLLPSDSGVGFWLYAIPIGLIAAAVLCLGWYFVGRQRRLRTGRP